MNKVKLARKVSATAKGNNHTIHAQEEKPKFKRLSSKLKSEKQQLSISVHQ